MNYLNTHIENMQTYLPILISIVSFVLSFSLSFASFCYTIHANRFNKPKLSVTLINHSSFYLVQDNRTLVVVSLIIRNTSALQNQLKGILADKRPSINNTHFSRLLPKQLFGLINKRRGMFIQRSIPDISKIACYHYSGKLDDEAIIPPFCTNEGYLAFTTDRAISSKSLKLRLCILTGSGKKFHKNIVLHPLDELWKA